MFKFSNWWPSFLLLILYGYLLLTLSPFYNGVPTNLLQYHFQYIMNKLNFYIVGTNIRTSLSPKIHNRLFQMKKKACYQYRLFKENMLPSLQQLSADENFGGMSITIPFKKTYYEKLGNFLPQLDVVDTIIAGKAKLKYVGEFANKSKIINTIVRVGDNQFQGYNTDLFGIQKVLKQCKVGQNVLLIGAGATSQTFCHYFCKKIECKKVFLWNRTNDKIKNLCSKYSKVVPAEDYCNQEISTIINTLPTHALQENYNILCQILRKIHTSNLKIQKTLDLKGEINIMDVNYRDQQRFLENLVKHAFELDHDNKNLSVYSFSGLDMLIWQAIAQNQLFCQEKCKQTASQLQFEQQYFYQIYKNIFDK